MEVFLISFIIGFVVTRVFVNIYHLIRLNRIDLNCEIRSHMLFNHFEEYMKLPSAREMLSIRHILKTDVKSWLKYTANK